MRDMLESDDGCSGDNDELNGNGQDISKNDSCNDDGGYDDLSFSTPDISSEDEDEIIIHLNDDQYEPELSSELGSSFYHNSTKMCR